MTQSFAIAATILCIAVLGGADGVAPLLGQETAPGPADAEAPASGWSADAEVALWILPDAEDFVLLQLSADRGSLHLEARYNYEDRRTVSAWVGWTWSRESTLSMSLTPMAGFVLGRTDGLAPGLEADLSIWRLEWYVEAEYLFDFGDASEDFFYAWSQLGLAATDWLSLGAVVQRTRVVDTAREMDRGPYLEATLGPASMAAFFLNPGRDDAVTVVQLGLVF
jgi:hypothetical protein